MRRQERLCKGYLCQAGIWHHRVVFFLVRLGNKVSKLIIITGPLVIQESCPHFSAFKGRSLAKDTFQVLLTVPKLGD